MTAPIAHPQKIYDFTNFSQTRPTQQLPGDRVDAQFDNHAGIIASLVDTIGSLTGQLVQLSQLDPAVAADLAATVRNAVQVQVNQAQAAAVEAETSANDAEVAAADAVAAAAVAQSYAAMLPGGSADITASFIAAEMRASAMVTSMYGVATTTDNSANDAARAAATAEDWANVSISWAEYMPDKIPPNILAITGVTGDHWSSRWWSNQASAAVSSIGGSVSDAQDAAADAANSAADAAASAAATAVIYDHFDDRYLGGKPVAPSTDNDGNALIIGSMYWNTATSQLFVWNGTSWNAVTTPSGSGIAASAVIFAPSGGLSSTNVQAALVELDTEKLGDAPADGSIYGRRNNAWIVSTSATIAWTDIVGKPASFPPSAHTHPTSEIVGLDAAIANAATDAELAAEAAARSGADTTLQGNINTVSGNLSTEVTNRTNADTAIQSQVTANTNAIATKVGEAPNDGKTYGRKSLSWAEVVGTATISISPPSSPSIGQLWWDSDSGNLFVYYDDGSSAQWVQLNYTPPAPDLSGYLQKSGGTMTGQLLLPTPGSAPAAAPKSYVDAGDAAVVAGVPAQVATALAAAQFTNIQGRRDGSGNVTLTPLGTWVKIPIVIMQSAVGGWSISGGGLVVPKTGTYQISAGAGITATSTTSQQGVGVLLNAATLPFMKSYGVHGLAAVISYTLNCSRLFNLTAGDVIYLTATNNVTGAVCFDAVESTFLSASIVAAY